MLLPHKREKRHLERCPPLRRIRPAGDDQDTVDAAGRERRFRRECRNRSQHSRRPPAVHRAARCLGQCTLSCSGIWRHSTFCSWRAQGSLRDCTRGTAPSPGFSSARWSCAGCMASFAAPTSRGASPCLVHWSGRAQLERRTQWTEGPPVVSSAQEHVSSACLLRSSATKTANGKGSSRHPGNCAVGIDRRDDSAVRSRIACGATAEAVRSGSGSRL